MRARHRTWRLRVVTVTLSGLVTWTTGCVSPWWNAFLAPQEVGNFRENRVSEIQQSISFRDKPLGIPGATDPTPEDLIATVEEYQVGPADTLLIRLLDFLQLGIETQLQLQVDELGYINVPQLGWIHVDGMTTRQIQAEVVRQAKNAEIYAEDMSPTVQVQILSRQHRTYNITGAIAAAGEYPIVRPDLRLREAINQAGSLADAVKTIYVFRNELRQKRIRPASATLEGPVGPAGMPQVAPPPVTPDNLTDLSASASPPASQPIALPARTNRPTTTTGQSLPSEEVEQELMEAVRPATTPAKPGAATGPPTPTMPTFIYVNNEFIEAPTVPGTTAATRSIPATTPLPLPMTQAPVETVTTEPVDWEELAAEGQQRVIRIPAEKIRQGDPNYNIVIRHQDWVQLDPGQVGLFYVSGHVMREGVFALNGEEITLTQAIVSAGGLDPIAWPTRCEIRRRIDGSREEITQWDLARIMCGQDPDLYIKKDDLIRVGTHAVAPLLATIRNSFRLTYGFGFVYDRNFADIDAYGPQQNPRDVRRTERQQLGLLD